MKKLFAVALLLWGTAGTAQAQIVFDEVGKVSSSPSVLKATRRIPVASQVKPTTTALDTWSAKQQQALATELTKSLSITLDSLKEPPSPLYNYYAWLWGNADLAQLVKDLDTIKTYLSKAPAPYNAPLLSTSPLYILDTLLQTRLRPKRLLYTLKDSATTSQHTLRLRKTAVNNDLLLACYQHISQVPANAFYRGLNVAGRARLLATAQRRQLAIDKLLREAGASGGVTLALLNRMSAEHIVFTQYHRTDTLFKLLRAPWAKAWLWRSNGVLTLNPLPFTNDELLLTRPVFDSQKAKSYDEYVKKALESKQAATTGHNIPAFTADLKLLGMEKSLFTDSTAYKKALTANRAAATKFQTAEFTVNAISVPQWQDDFEYRHLLSTHKEDILPVIKLDALSLDDRVMVSVHNIEKDHALRMVRKKITLITDESATQRGINDGLKSMAALSADGVIAAIIGKGLSLKPNVNVSSAGAARQIPTNLSSVTIKNANKAVINKRHQHFGEAEIEDEFWRGVEAAARAAVRKNLNGSNLNYKFVEMLEPEERAFDNNIFLNVKNKQTLAVQEYLKAPTEKHYEQLINDIVNAYFKAYLSQVAAPAAVLVLRTDSLHMCTSRTVLAQSTIPPHKITREVDKVPLFHSERAVTRTSDSTVHNVYHLQDVFKKDSVINSFSSLDYRTGKLHRIQFSAGLAYTFNPVREPELSTTNGQVKYTSTDSRYRFYAGLHYYPFRKGLLLQDKRFFGSRKTALSRLNMLVALGIPKPLDNIYLGAGYDFGPGIRAAVGMQLHGYRQYEVFNNTLVRDAKVYRPVFPFVSLGIDPVGFVSALNLFK